MKADWALAIRQALPKNLDEYKELQQNELFFDAGIGSSNFIAFKMEQYGEGN